MACSDLSLNLLDDTSGTAMPLPSLSASNMFSFADPTSSTLTSLRTASFDANSELLVAQQSLTNTGSTYEPYIRRYDDFWVNGQAAALLAEKGMLEPGASLPPSRPITATKVFWFLEHERTRKKVSRRCHLPCASLPIISQLK